MKLTLEEKIARDMPLTVPELMQATGYGRRSIRKIKPPLICRKISLSDFKQHVRMMRQNLTVDASLERSDGQLATVSIFDAQGRTSGPRASSSAPS